METAEQNHSCPYCKEEIKANAVKCKHLARTLRLPRPLSKEPVLSVKSRFIEKPLNANIAGRI